MHGVVRACVERAGVVGVAGRQAGRQVGPSVTFSFLFYGTRELKEAFTTTINLSGYVSMSVLHGHPVSNDFLPPPPPPSPPLHQI